MNHWIVAPIILPLLLGAILAWQSDQQTGLQRWLSLTGSLGLLLVSLQLVQTAGQGQVQIYSLGNWQAPFGIVLVLDRLSALMVFTTAALALLVNLYACSGDDSRGRYFHALFQFQVAGICGAFLTGDLFNLFVFFEILLIASYALLLHGGGTQRLRSAVHYVVLNLIGSTRFLLGAGLVYGISGTLNMADIARFVQQTEGDSLHLMHAAGWVLVLVFGLKAAILPLHFWLPRAYASASAPVAALFAIMTKVGLYAILRFSTLVFGEQAGTASGLGTELLWILALATILLAALGAFAASSLTSLLAYLVLVSVGTLLAGIAVGSDAALSATLYYLIHSTWVIAGLFLLADIIAKQRGDLGSSFKVGPVLLNPPLLGICFFLAAIAVAGLPPFSGFFGKALLLQAVSGDAAWQLWAVVLGSGLIGVIGLSRAGSLLFWRQNNAPSHAAPFDKIARTITMAVLLSSPLLVGFAQPVISYSEAAAAQIRDVASY